MSVKQATECLTTASDLANFYDMFQRLQMCRLSESDGPRLWIFCGGGGTGKSTLLKHLTTEFEGMTLNQWRTCELRAPTRLVYLTEDDDALDISYLKAYLSTESVPVHVLYQGTVLIPPSKRPDVVLVVNDLRSSVEAGLVRRATVIHFNHCFSKEERDANRQNSVSAVSQPQSKEHHYSGSHYVLTAQLPHCSDKELEVVGVFHSKEEATRAIEFERVLRPRRRLNDEVKSRLTVEIDSLAETFGMTSALVTVLLSSADPTVLLRSLERLNLMDELSAVDLYKWTIQEFLDHKKSAELTCE